MTVLRRYLGCCYQPKVSYVSILSRISVRKTSTKGNMSQNSAETPTKGGISFVKRRIPTAKRDHPKGLRLKIEPPPQKKKRKKTSFPLASLYTQPEGTRVPLPRTLPLSAAKAAPEAWMC